MFIARFKRLIIMLVVIAVVLAAWLVLTAGKSTVARSGEIVVEPGMGAQAVWRQFVDEHFTTTTWPWRYHAWRQGAAAKIQAGTYQIDAAETVPQVISRLVTGDSIPDEISITFPEGFTLEQMAARAEAKGFGSAADFKEAARPLNFVDRFPILKNIPSDRNLEGYLFPDTYQIFDDDTAADIIARQLANFNQKFTEDLRQEAAAQGRTLDQVIIMASIIEREVLTDDDMAMVSGILWKRLDNGIGLDADATVRYAVEKWDEPLTVQDLRVDSPYNTRRFRGLPPGPISNPGIRALVAAVRPETSEYFYYLSTPDDGTTIFARTNDEHNENKVKYLR